ncbi:MAG TPA: AAA family ATPase [Gammaproteobacteria bacterium]|nr:AAA family ATPase [Gammaproteobacteria bacterium]
MYLIQRYLKPITYSYFLFGPRGTGKSTWLAENYPEAVKIDLLKMDILRHYQARPERLEEVVRASKSTTIIIDEIQKVPDLLNVVHSLIEEKQGWQFILTGSSARKLKRAGVNLLAGRAIVQHLHPFMAGELKEQFSLLKTLQYGLVPLIFSSENMAETLKAYVGLYLEEEVKAENLVRNIGHFSRFLEVMSFSHGSILNINNIARECEISRKLVEGYLEVLEDLLLCFQLPIFTLRAKRAVISHPKFYYFDVGVYKSLRAVGFIDQVTEIDGPGLEGLVAQHLRAWNDYQGSPNRLYYWRTRYGVEVDFIIHGANNLTAIEVKNSNKINNKDLSGLKAFCTDYPEALPILLYRGQERLLKDGIICLPIEEFLRQLTPTASTVPS